MNVSDENYWSERYRLGNTGWDIGYISTPIREYIDQLNNKNLEILIPGAGNGYEAEYLHNRGFENTFILDISKEPLKNLKKRCPDFPGDHLIQGDFFEFTGQFDLIIEQTFFSAIHPDQRISYRDKMYNLLKPGGALVGLLWALPMNSDHPPYGGSEGEYRTLFGEMFEIKVLEPCYNSIPPRIEAELFINFRKPS